MASVNTLYKKKKNSNDIQQLADIFASKPLEIVARENEEQMDIENQQLNDSDIENAVNDVEEQTENVEDQEAEKEENPFSTKDLSLKQKQDRDEKTIFIGNIPLETNKKDLVKVFKKYGTIENIRERSIPVKQSADLPIKARVILKRFVEGNGDNNVKNCYILYQTKEAAEKALEKNGVEFKGNILRVDTAAKKDFDYTKTIFVGNLSYKITENELRKYFSKCGKIVNVRTIRDKETHLGKGFGYVEFEEIDGYQAAIEMKGSKMDDRLLRIKKAVPKARLEKKQAKKQQKISANQEAAMRRIQAKQDQEEEQQQQKKPFQKKGKKFDKDEVNIKGKAAKEFVEGQMDNIEDVDIENKIVVPPRMLRKSIKKQKKRGSDQQQQFKKVQEVQKKFHKKNDRNIFNGVQGLKDRKDKREKRRQQNRKKAKDQVINE